jgi:hypothetical protein
MKELTDFLPWFNRTLNRRSFIGRASATTFGVMAGMAVGAPRALAMPASIPCGPSPDCRSYSSLFCDGNQCTSGSNWVCTKRNSGCNSAGDYCWYSGGKKCCDCTCSWYGGGSGTVGCICYG